MKFEAQLKPCPFCGGKAKLKTHQFMGTGTAGYYLKCTKCNARTTIYGTRESLMNCWNRGFIFPHGTVPKY